MQTAYLAGPMTGIRSFNFPAFMEAASRLRTWGWVIFNPAEEDCSIIGEDKWSDYLKAIHASEGNLADLDGWGFDMAKAMQQDLGFIATKAEAVICLPGWDKSSGARAEAFVGRKCGLPVFLFYGGYATQLHDISADVDRLIAQGTI